MAAARVARGRRAPVTGDGKGRAAELLLAPVHLTVVAAIDGDDGGDGAAWPEMAGGGKRLARRGGDPTEH